MIDPGDSCRWRGFFCLSTFSACLVLAAALSACEADDSEGTSDQSTDSSRTTRLAVPADDNVPSLDVWISVADSESSTDPVALETLSMTPLGNISYRPLRDCLDQHSHDWPSTHAVTAEFELHAGKVQRGVADYVDAGDREPNNWPLPDDNLEDDPDFVTCLTRNINGPTPEALNIPDSAHLRVRTGLRPSAR